MIRKKPLIADALSPRALEIFRERGIEADVQVGLKPDALREIIGGYDGLAVRSATKVTRPLIESAVELKVIDTEPSLKGATRRSA